jgi:NAD+ synthase (glutamine-hydrolysing)
VGGEKKLGDMIHAPHIGSDLVGFCDKDGEVIKIGCVVGNDYGKIKELTKLGAKVIVNPTAQIATATMEEEREQLARELSYNANCAFVMCNAGEYESTTDALFTPHSVVAQKGKIISSTDLFDGKKGDLVCVIDTKSNKRRVKPAAVAEEKNSAHPFILDDAEKMDKRCDTILNIQAHALAKRLKDTYSKTMVVGISGGLDSTLALIVMVKAADMLLWDRKNVIAVTMPCFGTTERTKSNAIELCNGLGVTLREINIFDATRVHLRDIGHDESVRNVTYENAQARERTQILMDVANKVGGLVVGTGDLSESALGWCTYNGDHMSMYAINCDIPKTLVRHMVNYCASVSSPEISAILLDILDTPVSPELLPAKANGEIEQKTEDLVGPYDLHDFFIYNFVGRGLMPSELFARAKIAFKDAYTEEIIDKWLRVFIKKFVTQQFKRSCTPDGVKVCPVSLSPRGDFNMPSDMSYQALLDELDSKTHRGASVLPNGNTQ